MINLVGSPLISAHLVRLICRLRRFREGSIVVLVSLLPKVPRHVGGDTGSLVSPCTEHTQCSCPLGARTVKPCTNITDDVRNAAAASCDLSLICSSSKSTKTKWVITPLIRRCCMDALLRWKYSIGLIERVFCNLVDIRLEQDMEEYREQLTSKLARRG